MWICIDLGRLLTISSACALGQVAGLEGVAHDVGKHKGKKEADVMNSRHCVMKHMAGEKGVLICSKGG